MFVCPKCHRDRVGEKCTSAHTHRHVRRCDACGRTAKCIDCRKVEVPEAVAPTPPITITAENHPENR